MATPRARLANLPERRPLLALALFAGQFTLDLAWSAVFFGARSIAAYPNYGFWALNWRRGVPASRPAVGQRGGFLRGGGSSRNRTVRGGIAGDLFTDDDRTRRAMDTYVFHLMPYRAVEGEAWPFASDTWDPETGARYYEEYFEQLELADRLGYEGLGFNEHHFSPYGLQPSPVVTAAHAAARTEDARLAFFGNVLPIRSNPVRLAEELAMLDNISEGRVLAGFPRGIPVEYLAYGVDYDDSRARFAEALDLVLDTWTAEEPFDHHGEFWEFENVYAWPRPYQQPHPPLWMAAESDRSLRFAAEHRMQVGTGLASSAGVGERFRKYERFAEEAGWSPTEDDETLLQMVYVAETEEAAREEAREHLEFWNERLLGGVHLGATAAMMGDDRYDPERRDVYMENMNPHGKRAFEFDFDEAVESGDVTVGDPVSVTAELERKYEETGGFGKLAAGFQFGTLPPALTKKSLRLYADEVMPEVRKF